MWGESRVIAISLSILLTVHILYFLCLIPYLCVQVCVLAAGGSTLYQSITVIGALHQLFLASNSSFGQASIPLTVFDLARPHIRNLTSFMAYVSAALYLILVRKCTSPHSEL